MNRLLRLLRPQNWRTFRKWSRNPRLPLESIVC